MRVPRWLWLLLGLLFLCGGCGATTWWAVRPAGRPLAPPQVDVYAPEQNAQVPLGQPVEIKAGAYTTASQAQIARLLLWVDGRLAGERVGPANPLANAWQWTPSTPGQHTLIVQAIDSAGRRAAAYRTVNVTTAADDPDADGVAGDQDQCPDQPGLSAYQGCPEPAPDNDGDGVPNAQDACPDQAGPAENGGCPQPAPTDSDGEGVPDLNDACPNNPGPVDNSGCPLTDTDGDGVPDNTDACPEQAGPALNNGCPQPDADGDGVPDSQDACVNQPGPEANNGCPLTDNDGDGVPNDVDECPELSGDAALNGCPPWVMQFDPGDIIQPHLCNFAPALCALNQDSDGDGVPDGQDDCPDEPGPPLNHGCPFVAPHPGDAFPHMPCPFFLPETLCAAMQQQAEQDWAREETQPPEKAWINLASPAVITNALWNRLYCIARIDDGDWMSLDASLWSTTNARSWFIDEDLQQISLTPRPEGLQMDLLCWGWRNVAEGEVYLGGVSLSHEWVPDESRWNVMLESSGGENGYNFRTALSVFQCRQDCP